MMTVLVLVKVMLGYLHYIQIPGIFLTLVKKALKERYTVTASQQIHASYIYVYPWLQKAYGEYTRGCARGGYR